METATPPPPNAGVPITFPSWNTVFLCRQTQTRPRKGRNMTNGLVSNYEYCNGDGHMINSIDFPPPWCCNDSCDRFVGRLARSICSLSRLVTVLTDTWPPKFNESRIRADVAKRFLLVHRARLSSLCVDLQAYQLVDVPCQSLANVA